MQILSSGKPETIDAEALQMRLQPYQRVHIDIGTGDGRNIYKAALQDPDTFFIGIDPVRENMLEIAKKSAKKPAKGGAANMLLVIASAEALPPELSGIADSVSVYFPWGSLLECIIKPVEETLAKITGLMKPRAAFTFITTYSDSYEEGEMQRRGLPQLSLAYFQDEAYVSRLRALHLIVTECTEYDNEFVKQFNSLWAKRLAFGRKRAFYRVSGHFEG